MTISCNIYIPTDVRVNDLLDVIGILIGEEKSKGSFSNNPKNKFDYVEVNNIANGYEQQHKNIHFLTGANPQHFVIVIKNNPFDKEHHVGNYHFESDYFLLSGGSSPFWKQLGQRLIQFFGGWIDYDDCDKIDKDVEYSCPRKNGNSHIENRDFDQFQQDLWDLKPLWRKK